MVAVMHIFGFIWHGVALYEIEVLNRDDTWLHSIGLNINDSLYSHYIYSIYFLAVTMISIGYGDITA